MTREEAIGHIKDVICENSTIKPNIVVFEQEKEALYTAIKALEQEPKWIPVSEGLPKRNGYYLVTGRQGAVNKRRYHDGHWYGNWSVLAWMPLPKPYKAESEEI